MVSRSYVIGIASSVLLALFASFASASALPQVGDAYELTLIRDSAQHGEQGSGGSSHDRDTLVERVIGLRADGLELEYDLPSGATAVDRRREWHLPARVFKPFHGSAQLLNAEELASRLDGWLKFGNLSREACGHWIFTWNAFRIDCDPQTVIQMVEAYDLRSVELPDGAPCQDKDALAAAKLVKKPGGAGGPIFTVELAVDPEQVRRSHAESDVVVGEILKKPVSQAEAEKKHANEVISGTISITFEADPSGNARRRTKLTTIHITTPAGASEINTITETLERRLISSDK